MSRKKRQQSKRSLNLGTLRGSQQVTNSQSLQSVLNWFLPDDNIFAECKFHGNVKWNPRQLVVQALYWSWQEAKNVTTAFDDSLEVCAELGLADIAGTYPTFMNALGKYEKSLGACVERQFQALAEQAGERFWRDGEWVLMGFDGSRISAPRTVSNEKAFCAANHGHGTTAKYRRKKTKGLRRRRNEKHKPAPPQPQLWITLFWHMNLQLPWCWRLGPSDASERAHVADLLKHQEMPKNTLYCGDAGFVGYPLWSSILAAKGNFLVRVGGNVSLLGKQADFKRDKEGVVWCWPKDKMNSGAPPLKLRLVRVKIGKAWMWILTSVLDRRKLSVKKIVKYYQLRWGIELEFRSLKQTLGHATLRCRDSNRALVELDWSIRGLAVAKLLALREQVNARPAADADYTPAELSVAKIMRALRDCMRRGQRIPAPDQELRRRLAQALIQRYENHTDKKARYRPANPDKKPLGDPKIHKLTPEIKQKLQKATAIAA